MMMRKVYTTPAYFTMLLLKFFNLLLIFLSSPYVARNRCRFGWLAGGGFLVCGLFWVISWGASGPLARDFSWFLPCFRPFPGELVVHSTEWTTGAGLFLVFALFWAISGELVVHSVEWTTGVALFLDFGLVSDDCRGASGPLFKVDHWLGILTGFCPVFDGFLES